MEFPSHGRYGCALGWSGSWRIAVEQLPDGLVQITGGAGCDDSGLLRLAPGETYTTPVFAGLWSAGGLGGASRAWHAWQLAHVVPDAESLRFRFVSAMAGELGVGGDRTEWSDEEPAEAWSWVDLYKEIRPAVQHGALYRLRAPRGGLSAVQYVHANKAAVLMWLEAQRYGERPPALRLRGLGPAATCTDLDAGAVHHGAVLLHQGLHTGLRGAWTRRC